ncbi:hypothetical protein CsSME_00045146 [Camellia sinensis var. sinensis]
MSSKVFLCQPNMELKMSKKVLPDSYPTTVKKLLSTGILEGARVKYVTASQERELPGIIKGCGYLCGCSLCNFSKILSAYEFELHAGGKTRHPSNHIYLENGKPIYSVIQELKTAPHSVLDEVVKNVAGSSVNEESFQAWKESLQENSHMVKTEKRRHISVPGMHHATTRYIKYFLLGIISLIYFIFGFECLVPCIWEFKVRPFVLVEFFSDFQNTCLTCKSSFRAYKFIIQYDVLCT